MNTDQPVRCCSNVDVDGSSGKWKGVCDTNSGVTVFGGSPGCERMSFTDAIAHYESFPGGRLCNPDEMEARCTRYTGCSFNKFKVWACIAKNDKCDNHAECCDGYCNSAKRCEQLSNGTPPTLSPTHLSTSNPTSEPSSNPTSVPTSNPTLEPSNNPTDDPLNLVLNPGFEKSGPEPWFGIQAAIQVYEVESHSGAHSL